MSSNRLATLVGALIALAIAPPAPANTPMQEYIEFARTDHVVAGVGGIGAADAQGGGRGEVVLAGVSGTVTLALLYWNGIDVEMPALGLSGGDADYDQPVIRFEGQELIGTRVAGFNDNDCWPLDPAPPSSALYRADVTAFVQARGNGSYVFSDLSTKPAHSANGMSLIVYFNDGNPANDLRITHYEGTQSSQGNMTFEFPLDYTGGNVAALLHVSDGQSNLVDGGMRWRAKPAFVGSTEHTIRYRGLLHDGLLLWAGNSVPVMGHGRENGPGLWDIRRMPLTPLYGPLRRYDNRITYENTGSDCVSLQVAQIIQSPDVQAPALSPNPFDFGDVIVGTQSAPQRFTLKNPMPGNITVGTPTSNTGFSVVANTCASQIVAPGATCTVDVVYQPTGASLPVSTELRIPFTDTALSSTSSASFFAELRGAGVPNVPFSRVEPQPRECTFAPGQVGIASAPVRFRMASTGTLPVTITRVWMFSGATPPVFNIIGSDCIGQTLQPASSCSADISLRPRAAGNTDTFLVDYTAADATAGRIAVPVEGTAVAATGDRVFVDGFDPAACVE